MIAVTAWKASVLKRMQRAYAKARREGNIIARSRTFEEWVDYMNPPKRGSHG